MYATIFNLYNSFYYCGDVLKLMVGRPFIDFVVPSKIPWLLLIKDDYFVIIKFSFILISLLFY